MIANNGSIHPFGDTLYTLDKDFSWKRNKLVVGANPAANTYNLVQLKPSAKGDKPFQITKMLPTSTDAPYPVGQGLEPEISTQSSTLKPRPLQSSCKQPLASCMTPVTPPQHRSVPEFLKQDNHPEYINVCDSVKWQYQPEILHESGENKAESGSEEYENWTTIQRIQKDSSDSNVPSYINLRART